MKKIAVFFCIVASVSSAHGMYGDQYYNKLINEKEDNKNNDTIYNNDPARTKEDSDDYKLINNLNINKNQNSIDVAQKPLPNTAGMLAFFMNLCIGAGTEYFKAQRWTRASVFLLTNVACGIWYNQEARAYAKIKDNGKCEKNAAEFKPYSSFGHFLGALFGATIGTGVVVGLREANLYLAQRKRNQLIMELKNTDAYINSLKK